jgi:hypothetical protein
VSIFTTVAQSEKSINISTQDGRLTIRGNIDVLITQDRFWILVIESKQTGISIDASIPQALTYMLAAPDRTKPRLQLLTPDAKDTIAAHRNVALHRHGRWPIGALDDRRLPTGHNHLD